MAERVGPPLTDELWAALSKGALFREGGRAAAVLTVDAAGWPHVALVGEVVALDRRRLAFPLGRATQSRRFLESSGRATLVVADEGCIAYLKGWAEVVRDSMRAAPFYAGCRLQLEAVLDDREPSIAMTSGLRFRFLQDEEAGVRLTRAVLEELAELV